MTGENGQTTTAPTLRERLRAPLPKEAIKQHPTKKWSSSINGAFIIERFNDVFGEGSWLPRYELIENRPDQKMVVIKTKLYINSSGGPVVLMVLPSGMEVPDPASYDIYRETFGGNDNPDRGDAYKGACTDGLGKAASQLGIAGEVYKGMLDEVQAPADGAKKTSKKKYESIAGRVTNLRNQSPNVVWIEINNNGIWVRTVEVKHADALRKSLGCKVEATAFWDKQKFKGQAESQDIMTISAVHGVYEAVPRTEYVKQQPAEEDEHISPDMRDAGFSDD